MKDKVFIDTNIFVYASTQSADDKKHFQAVEFLKTLDHCPIVVSTQVISELFQTLLKKKIDEAAIYRLIDEIVMMVTVVPVDLVLLQEAFVIRRRYGFSLWDSQIISAALTSDCNILYTEDMQNAQWIGKKLQIINPFLQSIGVKS